jgi:glycosyltransferase involved in cell wall biosynthesis
MIAPKGYPLFNPAVKGVVGGAEVDLYYLATELARDPMYQLSFLCADYGQPLEERRKHVRVFRSVNFRRSSVVGAWHIWQGMKKANAHIYMMKTISFGMFLVAFYCWLHRRHFVFRTSNKGSCDGTYVKAHPVMGRLYKWALRSAARVFVQNKEDIDDLHRCTGVRAEAVPNGHRIPARPMNRMPDTILWVGRSVAIKQPYHFLELARRCPDIHFTMICQRATGDQQYMQLVHQVSGIANLEFIENVPFDRMSDFYQRAQVLVNTSDAEGFPNTFIEACQYEVPILSLAVDPDGFLTTYDCGVCCHGDMDAMAMSLQSLLQGHRYQRLGQQARAYVEANHDIARVAKVYKTVFQSLSSKGTRRMVTSRVSKQ